MQAVPDRPRVLEVDWLIVRKELIASDTGPRPIRGIGGFEQKAVVFQTGAALRATEITEDKRRILRNDVD